MDPESESGADGRGDAHVAGVARLPNGTHQSPERDLATEVLREAVADAGRSLSDVDGLYMPKPRPWTDQGFFSTLLVHGLGLDLRESVETYTGGTSSGHAFQTAVHDVRAGRVGTAVVLAVERNSVIETDRYLEYILSIFDREFQSPAGPTIPGVYAMSLQRYLYDYDVARTDVAEVVAKNRRNAASNPDALFDEPVTTAEVLDSRPVADPLRLYECPAPCDGGAALVVTSDPDNAVRVAGTGYHHPPSHLLGVRDGSLAEFPAVAGATSEALSDAGYSAADLDVLEPYAPFPHVEAILTEELGLFERGNGAAACARGETSADGPTPVSPSGGCVGRGHPAMVTPLLNYIAAVEQLQGEAPLQIPGAQTVLTTSEHGHVDGVTATVFEGCA